MSVASLHVPLAQHAYSILIGEKAWLEGSKSLPAETRVCVITDDNVSPLYLERLNQVLDNFEITRIDPFVVRAGEQAKDWEILKQIVDHLLVQKVDRHTNVIALGGGVVGDLAGFAASITLRGLPFIQVPTTLLAQVDSSVGGKTGINTDIGKNLIGSFYQPKAVWIDTECLNSLSLRDFKAGYAEILKYSFINDAGFFAKLDAQIDKIMARDQVVLREIITASCQAKTDIVVQDEKEATGQRALLNLGHTFGHALEALGGYDGRILHGEAVGIGMLMAAGFSERAGMAPKGMTDSIHRHMSKAGLMLQPPFPVTAEAMIGLMRQDKKSRNGKIQLVLMRGIGNSFLAHNIEEAALTAFLDEWIAESQKI